MNSSVQFSIRRLLSSLVLQNALSMARQHNIFISWSGARSKAIAEALREWLPTVIQTAKPFMSDTDIDKGSRGLTEVIKALEGMKVGIVCLTPENLNEPWILYEAGALSKTIDDKTRLCTYLLAGLQSQNVRQPLGMFQHTVASKEETWKLIRTVNSSISDDPVSDSNLKAIFEKMWPELEKTIENIPSPDQVVEAKRLPDEMLAEILDLSRATANSRKQSEWIDQYAPLMKQFFPLLEQLVKGAQTGVQTTPPQPQQRAIFRVKVKYEDEIKKIEGTAAVEDAIGRLVIVDGDQVVARFDETERWWKESGPA
jgi:hypothetical protein